MKKLFFILMTALVAFSCNKEESADSQRVDRIFVDGKLVKEFRYNQPSSNAREMAPYDAEPIPGKLLEKTRNSTGGWNVRCETGGGCCWSCNQ